MTRWDFQSFKVRNANERAVRVCQAAAEPQSVTMQPIVICGEQGSGKTHLLCSTAYYARAKSSRVALFGVTPEYFPDRVRRLATDSSPLRNGHEAMLLVDDLESITGFVHELEAIVRVFVANGQPVVFCSSIPPERLRNVTPGLRAILSKGLTVDIQAGKSGRLAGPSIEVQHLTKRLEEVESEKAALADLMQQLDEQLRSAREDTALARAEADELTRRCESLVQEIRSERERLSDVERHHGGCSQEIESLKARQGELAAELAESSARVRQLETEVERVSMERDNLQTRLSAAMAERDDASLLLAQTRAEREALCGAATVAREEANVLETGLDRALAGQATLQSEMESLRAEVVRDAEQTRLQSAQNLAAVQQKADQLEEMNKALDSEKTELTDMIQRLQSQLDASREQYSQSREEIDGMMQRTEMLLFDLANERGRSAELEDERNKNLGEIETLREQQRQSAAEADVAKTHLQSLQRELDAALVERDEMQSHLKARLAQREAALAAASSTTRAVEKALRTVVERSQARKVISQTPVEPLRPESRESGEGAALLDSTDST